MKDRTHFLDSSMLLNIVSPVNCNKVYSYPIFFSYIEWITVNILRLQTLLYRRAQDAVRSRACSTVGHSFQVTFNLVQLLHETRCQFLEFFKSLLVIAVILAKAECAIDREEAIVGLFEARSHIRLRAGILGLVLVAQMHKKEQILPVELATYECSQKG